MKKVNIENLKDAANRLLFSMSDEEYVTLLKEFDTVIKQMEFIANNKDIDSYSPMFYPFECSTDVLREDNPSKPVVREEILKNAKNKVAGQIKLPKVVS